jgi:hypothetical protein
MRALTDRPPKPALGLAWRLFTAMSLVVLAGAGTLLFAALIVARPVFHSHLDQIRPLVSAQAQTHVDEAFSNALFIALLVGVTFALMAALVVTWLWPGESRLRWPRLPRPPAGSPTVTTRPGFASRASARSSTG